MDVHTDADNAIAVQGDDNAEAHSEDTTEAQAETEGEVAPRCQECRRRIEMSDQAGRKFAPLMKATIQSEGPDELGKLMWVCNKCKSAVPRGLLITGTDPAHGATAWSDGGFSEAPRADPAGFSMDGIITDKMREVMNEDELKAIDIVMANANRQSYLAEENAKSLRDIARNLNTLAQIEIVRDGSLKSHKASLGFLIRDRLPVLKE